MVCRVTERENYSAVPKIIETDGCKRFGAISIAIAIVRWATI